MENDVTTVQKTTSKTRLRRILSAVSIVIGGGAFVYAAALVPGLIRQQNIPPLKSLKSGTYVPAQVVFKVKDGKSATTAIKKMVGKKQVLYKKKDAEKYVPLADANTVAEDASYKKVSVTLHQKNVQQLFVEPKVNDEVRNKILRRPGAEDPKEIYKKLGLDQWYVATVTEEFADVGQLIQQLQADTGNIEIATENRTSTTPSLTTVSTPGEPPAVTGVTQGEVSCDNPNDPYSCKSGDLSTRNYAVQDQYALDDINVREAWNTTRGSAKTVVAVVDSGVDTRHPDLMNKQWINTLEDINHNGCADYWPQSDFSLHKDCKGRDVIAGGDVDHIDNDSNRYIDDVNGMSFYENATPTINTLDGPMDLQIHGTGVAGIIAASTNDATGMAGICPNCLIMPIRSIEVGGDDVTLTRGVMYAIENGADVVNLSLGGEFKPLLQQALVAASYAKVTIVAATGNENTQVLYPASDPNVIAVGGVNYNGQRWWDSLTNGSNWGSNISVVAPSVEIFSALAHLASDTEYFWALGHNCAAPIANGTCLSRDHLVDFGYPLPDYLYATGTSFAAPIVSGVVGLMKSINPALDPYDVRNILELTAKSSDSAIDENGVRQNYSENWNPYTGYGIVDANLAVRQAYDRRPDFCITITPGTNPIIAVDSNKVRFDVWVENRGWSTVANVPYQVVNADTNEVVYRGKTATLYGNVGGWLNETVTLTTIPTRVKIVLDPDNLYPEPFENDNTSSVISITAFGTPYINHQDQKSVELGASVSFSITATDSNTPSNELTYSAENLPPSATYSNNFFSWSPPSSLSSGTYYPIFSVSDPEGHTSAAAVPIYYNNQSAVTVAGATTTMTSFEEAETHWSTNVPADSRIDYGSTDQYGDFAFNPAQQTDHTVNFRVLPGTTYHYKITSCTFGDHRTCVTTGDQVYAAPVIPVAVMSNFQVSINKDRWPYLITAQWDTNVPTSGQMNWGIQNTNTRTDDDVTWDTHHEISVPVQPNTTYMVSGSGCTNQPQYYQRCQEGEASTITTPGVLSPPTPKVTFNNNTAQISWSCTLQSTAGTVQLFLQGQLVASRDYSGTNNSVSFPVTPNTSYTYHIRGTNSGYWCSDMNGLGFTSPAYNAPPTLPTLPALTAYRGTVFSYQFPVATDPEGTTITYSLTGLPPGATFDSGTRKMSWIVSGTASYASSYSIKYTATDAGGASVSATTILSVKSIVSSFLPGTKVTLADHTTRAIEEIVEGDSVLTYNSDAKSWGTSVVTQVFVHEAQEYYIINHTLHVTALHPLWTNRGWVTVVNLRVGDRLLTEQGYIPVTEKTLQRHPVTVYNLEIGGDHTYLADGVVVHNKQQPTRD